MIGKLAGKALMDVAIPFIKDALPKLVSNVVSNVKQKGRFPPGMMAPMAASLIVPTASSLIQLAASLINAITGEK